MYICQKASIMLSTPLQIPEAYPILENYPFDSLETLFSTIYQKSPIIYNEFTLEKVKENFGLTIQKANLFEKTNLIVVSDFLQETLRRGFKQLLLNEKVRSEVIVMPILL